MKKVTFMIKQEYEMPDHVKLVNVNDEIGECLFLHGMFLQPTLIFSKISNIDVENGYVASRLTDEEEEKCIPNIAGIDFDIKIKGGKKAFDFKKV